MVTGKNKEQFEKWYFDNDMNIYMDLRSFYLLPLSMQWGVYLEYYDSLGIVINLFNSDSPDNWGTYILLVGKKAIQSAYKYKTRQEAQTEALKKANEIVNERLND